MFDQQPNVACITSKKVITGAPVLVATHYEDDHSWAFLDGAEFDPVNAMVVAMSTVLELHPELHELAPMVQPGWSASRVGIGHPWEVQRDHWEPDDA
ncbi:hypothetical protein [Sphingopyxis sp. Geo25]|nr:hypothetical protein [Sphingopyxis sp. Geo25]